MKTVVKWLGFGVIGVLVLGTGFYLWASVAASRALARVVPAHTVGFPVPFPLEQDEVEEMGLTPEEAEELALERALERGRHLVEARYACGECHGENFGGGVMVDAFPIGRLLGPNLTGGQGGLPADYSVADWDRIVRHGILPDGRKALMPSEDFLLMSDQELSDIIAWIRVQPPVDNQVRPSRLGPLGKVLVATGQIVPSADLIEEHDAPHLPFPPPSEASVEFGRHLAGVCTGCHGPELTGGRIQGGDPAWPPASDLTPGPEGLAGWSLQDFEVAMREGRSADGAELREPMTFVMPYARRMTDVELEALWVFLRSLPEAQAGS